MEATEKALHMPGFGLSVQKEVQLFAQWKQRSAREAGRIILEARKHRYRRIRKRTAGPVEAFGKIGDTGLQRQTG